MNSFDINNKCGVWEKWYNATVEDLMSHSSNELTKCYDGPQDNSRLQQHFLLKIITLLVTDSRIEEIKGPGKGQTWYLFANAVASYSSYNRYYGVSTEALSIIIENKINPEKPVSRRRLFDIRGISGRKLLTFEHLCPATYLIEILLSSIKKIKDENINEYDEILDEKIHDCIRKLLSDYGLVAVISKNEDNELKGHLKYKLRTTQEKPLDQMKERYQEAGIELESYITVYGKMYR
jgi:hypothetical protein